jgi:hypothetical protein
MDSRSRGEDTGRFNVERLTLKAVGDTNGYGGPSELHILMERDPPPALPKKDVLPKKAGVCPKMG